MPIPAYAAYAAAAAPAVAGLFGKKKTIALETPEQKAARQALLGFAQTGQYGDFKAGEDVNLGYGDYNPTGIERQGLSTLQGLLSGGIPDQFRLGDDALREILATGTDGIDAQFDPFKAKVKREISEAERGARRGAAFTGNLYSTDTIRKLGDVNSRGVETLTSELARLTDNALNRKLSAIPLAYQSAEAQEGLALNRVGASQQYGGLTRQLNDASIKARDAEILRRREELKLPIQAATSVAGGPSQIPEIQSSPYQDLLKTVGQIGGQYVGADIFARQYDRFFPKNTNLPNNGSGISLYNPAFGYPRYS